LQPESSHFFTGREIKEKNNLANILTFWREVSILPELPFLSTGESVS
jgi:hypothetical protein